MHHLLAATLVARAHRAGEAHGHTLADRAAPVRLRNDPIARELTEEVIRRVRRQMLLVDSLLDASASPGKAHHEFTTR